MARLSAENPYKKELFGLMHTIEKQLNMDRDDVMLVLLELDTEEKIQSFFRWIKTQLDGERVLATPREIVNAACDISDRRDKTVRIMELTKLCLEKPFSTEKIQSYIAQNNMDSEEVSNSVIFLFCVLRRRHKGELLTIKSPPSRVAIFLLQFARL